MRRFETMRPALAESGVEIVAISKDSVKDVRAHQARDGLSLTLLADPELDVIRLYGVEHHKAIEFSTVRFSLFGIPLALVPTFKTMAIPTSLLIDESGLVRWIDQADDYRLRSSEERVLAAVNGVFKKSA